MLAGQHRVSHPAFLIKRIHRRNVWKWNCQSICPSFNFNMSCIVLVSPMPNDRRCILVQHSVNRSVTVSNARFLVPLCLHHTQHGHNHLKWIYVYPPCVNRPPINLAQNIIRHPLFPVSSSNPPTLFFRNNVSKEK